MSDLSSQADELEGLRGSQPLSVHADELDAMRKKKPASTEAVSSLGTNSENFAAGAGKAVVDLGRGAKQLMDIPAKWLEKRFPGLSQWAEAKGLQSAEASAAQTEQDVAASRVADAPLMKTGAGIAGNIAGNVAATMLPLGMAAKAGAPGAAALLNPTTYKAAAASGALTGALQPVTGDDSRAVNTGVGAVTGIAGNALVNGVGRIAQPVTNSLSSAHAKAVDVLERAGIPLDAAQKTGSTFLNKVRSSFWDNPFTAGAQSELAAGQRAGYNRALLKTIGEDATAATPEVMARAEARIGNVFEDVLNRNDVKVTNSVLTKIGNLQKAANDEEQKAVAKVADRVLDAVQPGDVIPGQRIYNIKKDLDRLSSSSDTNLAYHARQLRSTIMDSINDSLSGADKAAFAEARLQFGNMKKIEPTIDRLGNGDISPAKLANVMAQKANRRASVYGKGDQELVDLAHAGNLLLPDRNPNSGTTARAMMQIAAPLLVGAGTGAKDAYQGDWGGAMQKGAVTAASLYAIPKAAQMMLNSPGASNYLANGMQGAMTPIRDLMLLPQNNQAVGGAVRRLPQAFIQSNR